MKVAIIGGDERMVWLARLLNRRGDRAGVLLRDGTPEVPALAPEDLARVGKVVMNFPARVDHRDAGFWALLERVAAEVQIYTCGPKHPGEMFGDRPVVDLWSDEALLADNARLTAEGAVAAAMRASVCALREMRALVVGWGRIGGALTELLVNMAAGVTVASRTEPGRNRAVERGAEAVATQEIADALPGHRLILNTAPSLVLDAAALARVDGDAMLIDLASPPYGIDLHAAWTRGLRAWREPALPGRYCPESAARALLRAMDRHDGKGDGGDAGI